MPHVASFDGTRIHCRVVGDGPAIVLLPGINLSLEVFDRVTADLAGSHRVIGIDLRGHGRSDKPAGEHSYATLVRDVDAVLSELAVSDAALLGWSFGGAIALAYAVAHPERVAKLVLLGAAVPRFAASADWPWGLSPEDAQARIEREHADRPAFRRAILESLFHRAADRETIDWLWQLSMQTPSWSSIACRESLFREDLRPALAALRIPTLIVHGVHDAHVPFACAEEVAKRLANAQLLRFEQSGHAPHLEEPDELTRALRAFLAGEKPSRRTVPCDSE